jgi:hypothetical protein
MEADINVIVDVDPRYFFRLNPRDWIDLFAPIRAILQYATGPDHPFHSSSRPFQFGAVTPQRNSRLHLLCKGAPITP